MVRYVTKLKKLTIALVVDKGKEGVINPALHYRIEELVSIALFLTYMAKLNKTASEIK